MREAVRPSGGCQHHRDPRAREGAEHFGVAGKVVSAGEQCGLVDRRGDDPVDRPRPRHLHRALDGATREPSSQGSSIGIGA
jgi:hypothetical protein